MSAADFGWLNAPVTTMALCWRIERRDGIGIGLTAHDRDLFVDGNLYRAAPGMTPSAIRRGDGQAADTMDVTGALVSSAIRESDLLGGLWDGARVAIFAVDWSDPGADVVPLGGGTIGAVETGDSAFTAELRGTAHALDAPVVEFTSPQCRADLGDARCRVSMAVRRRLVRVTGAADEVLTLDTSEPIADGWGGGRLRWIDGANAGVEDVIVASSGHTATLATVPRFAVVPGDRAEAIEGCDKSIATCAARFANAENFRGEPYLPGIDLLTRYSPS